MNKTKFYPILLVGYKNIFMKNLYLLKTDKLSKLHKTIPKNNLILTTEYKFSNKWENYHLYVVSDEEVKNDDYFIVNEKFIQRCVKSYENWLKNNKDNLRYTIKKIILTTDLDLINDNIQAIDDEFLNWYVNNDNCEEVDVKQGFADGTAYGYNFLDYKIIIPEKELNQETLEEKKKKVLKEIYFKNNPEKSFIIEERVNNFIKQLESKQQEQEITNIEDEN